MFTGIVTARGRVARIRHGDPARFVIETDMPFDDTPIGASIACSGVCLTMVERGAGWFAVDVSAETLSRTTLGDWTPGTSVNLERALRLGDELGGHLVSGHVDAVGTVLARCEEAGSIRLTFAAPAALMPFIAPKGSITVDGVSLTVNEVTDTDDTDSAGAAGAGSFGVNIIPHTAVVTTLGACRPGTRVNLEIDLIARYVRRLLAKE
ncbi:MAG: riboflavin synthase [Alphaproteobacteria bacterium]|nr:MAG: riboflavin synthase [Alphaproteobacteria bacterium]